jgi:flagellar biosynthesis anti-sigma factor FlgM
MKIHDRDLLGVGSTGSAGPVGGADSRAAGRAGQGTRTAGEDRAELSGLAARVSEEVRGEAADRLARVAELRELVKSGRYEANAEATARRLVDEALAGDVAGAAGSARD